MPKPKVLFSDQSSLPPLKEATPTPAQIAEMNAMDAEIKQNIARRTPRAVKTEKKAASSSVTVIPGKRAGGMVRGDGCATKGKTKGRCC